MADLEFWSDDRKFGLQILQEQVTEILGACRESCPNETGGILLGRYTETLDCAVVKVISKAPPDSRSGKNWFNRGVQGLQALINRLWRKEHHYYLGEWHFHPFGAPNPSETDRAQMQEIADSAQYHCPEPILVIVGGNPADKWKASAFIFRRRQTFVNLIEFSSNGS